MITLTFFIIKMATEIWKQLSKFRANIVQKKNHNVLGNTWRPWQNGRHFADHIFVFFIFVYQVNLMGALPPYLNIFFLTLKWWSVDCVLSMWGKIMIPMYRIRLHDLYGLYGPRCPLFPEMPLNLIIHPLAYHNCCILVHVSLKIILTGPNNNKPASV